MAKVAALVLAAGRGTRFGAEVPKQYRTLAGRPVLRHSLERFCSHPAISQVCVAYHPDDEARYQAAVAGLDLTPPVAGGSTRQDSAHRGLERLAEAAPDYVLIHDAARPYLRAADIDNLIQALQGNEAALLALPLADTLKREEAGRVADTVPRAALWRAMTPQAFHFDAIRRIHQDYAGQEHTDDASLAEAAGLSVALVEGSAKTMKITREEDLEMMEALLGQAPRRIRVGSGYDVHRFSEGDSIRLCGVDIAHNATLAGHSDADVGLHALTDALLGAFARGDIGQHFPPSDPQWRAADSAIFLQEAARLLRAEGGQIDNVDVTLICERPKISPHREAMRARIAELLALDIDDVSVKATTTEGLGFTGRQEGIAAQATATVSLPPRGGEPPGRVARDPGAASGAAG